MNDTVTRGQIQVSVNPTAFGDVGVTEYRMTCEHASVAQYYCNERTPPHHHVETSPGRALMLCWLEWARDSAGLCHCRLPATINARLEF